MSQKNNSQMSTRALVGSAFNFHGDFPSEISSRWSGWSASHFLGSRPGGKITYVSKVYLSQRGWHEGSHAELTVQRALRLHDAPKHLTELQHLLAQSRLQPALQATKRPPG